MPDLYMRVEDATVPSVWPVGDYADGTPAKLLKVTSFSHSLSAQISPVRPSALKAQLRRSYCQHAPVLVTRMMDNASQSFFSACASGKIFKAIQLISCLSDSSDGYVSPEPILTLQLSNVAVGNYTYSTTEVEQPTESMELHYTSVNMIMKEYDAENNVWQVGNTKSWSGTTNKSESDNAGFNGISAENTLFP